MHFVAQITIEVTTLYQNLMRLAVLMTTLGCLTIAGSTTEGMTDNTTTPNVTHVQTIDGNWATWMTWQHCSVTCGGGTRNRSRTCTDPTQENDGNKCVGNTSQTEICNDHPCPVDGNWTTWTTWQHCSVTCGGGTRNRSRTCTDPTPEHDGNKCVGNASQTEICNDKPCPGYSQAQRRHDSFSEGIKFMIVVVGVPIIGGLLGCCAICCVFALRRIPDLTTRARKENKKKQSFSLKSQKDKLEKK